MNLVYTLLILAGAVPGVRWVMRELREPPERRSRGAVAGISLFTGLSTAALLALLYFEYLV